MKRVFILSAGMTLCFATALPAQSKSNLDGEKILADFAHCAVRAAPRTTRMVIDTAPASEDEKSQIDLLLKAHGECLNFGPSIQGQQLAAEVGLGRTTLSQAMGQLANEQRQMILSSQAFRGAIAERLYLDLSKAKSAASPLPGAVGDRDAGLSVGYVVVRCAVAQDPVSADRLVRSKRLSSEEAGAGRAFAPALNSCARGKGQIDITGTAIHGWAAEALYKQRRLVATEGR